MDNNDCADDSDRKCWEILHAHLQGATPAQWHMYAARSNYDGNARGIGWLIDNPRLDRATALLLYWNLGAAWYVQFASPEDMQCYERETFSLLLILEQRYRDDFYTGRGIYFDPHRWEGGRPDDYPELPVRRAIPALMSRPAEGDEQVDVDDADYDDGVPMEIAEKLFAVFD